MSFTYEDVSDSSDTELLSQNSNKMKTDIRRFLSSVGKLDLHHSMLLKLGDLISTKRTVGVMRQDSWKSTIGAQPDKIVENMNLRGSIQWPNKTSFAEEAIMNDLTNLPKS